MQALSQLSYTPIAVYRCFKELGILYEKIRPEFKYYMSAEQGF